MAFASRLALALLISGQAMLAQDRPTFEVASIKRDIGAAYPVRLKPGGRLEVKGLTLSDLIQFAYGIVDAQVIGGPDWIRRDRFEITAKAAEPDAPESQFRLMMQSLLEDRFKLVMHSEQREMPVQEIVLHRVDGRVGPRLVQIASQDECLSAIQNLPKFEHLAGAQYVSLNPQCGSASRILGRLIYDVLKTVPVDKTGLTGIWAIGLAFAPDRYANVLDPSIPSFTTALQDQLGLRLRSTRASVDVQTIQSVEQPTPN